MTAEAITEEPNRVKAPVAEVGTDAPDASKSSKPVNAKLAFDGVDVKVASVKTVGSTDAGFPKVQLSLEVFDVGIAGCPWVPKNMSKVAELLQDDAADVGEGSNVVTLAIHRSWENQRYSVGCNTLGWSDFDVELVGKPKLRVVGKNDDVKTALSWKVQGIITEPSDLWRINQLTNRSDVALTSNPAQGDLFD